MDSTSALHSADVVSKYPANIRKQHRDPNSGFLTTGSPELAPWEEKKNTAPAKKAVQTMQPAISSVPMQDEVAACTTTKTMPETKTLSTSTKVQDTSNFTVPHKTKSREHVDGSCILLCGIWIFIFAVMACIALTQLDKPTAETLTETPRTVMMLLAGTMVTVTAAFAAVQADAYFQYQPQSSLENQFELIPPTKTLLKQVRFNCVTIREHELEAGGSGVVISDGAPLGLGWAIVQEQRFDVNEFEAKRSSVRREMDNFVQEGCVSSEEREQRLLDGGLDPSSIEKSSKDDELIQRLRQRSNDQTWAYRWQRYIIRNRIRAKTLTPGGSWKNRRSTKLRASLCEQAEDTQSPATVVLASI